MSVEQADVVDGVGLDQDGYVEMLISDHLDWNDPRHIDLLAAKVEAYVGAVLSGQLVQSYPAAEGKPVRINLVWQHVPSGDAPRFFETAGQQLSSVGIQFKQTALPEGF